MTETREETKDHQTRQEQDLEQSEQEEESLRELVDENVGHEGVWWPYMNREDYWFWNTMCFLCNFVLIPTGLPIIWRGLKTGTVWCAVGGSDNEQGDSCILSTKLQARWALVRVRRRMIMKGQQ